MYSKIAYNHYLYILSVNQKEDKVSQDIPSTPFRVEQRPFAGDGKGWLPTGKKFRTEQEARSCVVDFTIKAAQPWTHNAPHYGYHEIYRIVGPGGVVAEFNRYGSQVAIDSQM